MKLVFASNNAHKLQEVRQCLPASFEIYGLAEIGYRDDIEETGRTLEENSRIKAETIWKWICETHKSDFTGVFADDTGLEVDALDGAPGVYSARYAGEPSCDVNNRAKLLGELLGKENRKAQFRTVITLILDGNVSQMDGVVKGEIDTEERGTNGFGYDRIFIPEGYDHTFAELPTDVKNKISHRARALVKLNQYFGTLK